LHYLITATLVGIRAPYYIIGMDIGNLNLSGNLFLAPLAGVSNRPFRLLARRYGADLVFSEMVSAEGIIRTQERTLDMMKFTPDEQPIGIQLFGANPVSLKEAAAITAEQLKPDLIDINFGCPVKKVVKRNGGAALLKDLDLSQKIIEGVVSGANGIPVTIKIRSGWDESNPVFVQIGRIAEEAGVSAISMHARSRAGKYESKADWDTISQLKDSVSIPVIGNGDIRCPEDAKNMIKQTNCDGVMIGRAAMSNPMIFQQVREYLSDGVVSTKSSTEDMIALALEHTRLNVESFGPIRGIKKIRRQLGSYVCGFHGASKLRPLLHLVNSIEEIELLFDNYLKNLSKIE
jgi:tRNA-dihydrouridine synthase B